MRRALAILLAAAAAAPALPTGSASAAVAADDGARTELLRELPVQYRQAVRAHDADRAAQLRIETRLLAEGGDAATLRLAAALDQTRDVLQPWPAAAAVDRLVGEVETGARAPVTATSSKPYGAIRATLEDLEDAARAGDRPRAVAAGLQVAALSRTLERRLGTGATDLHAALYAVGRHQPGLLVTLDQRDPPSSVDAAAARVRSRLGVAEQLLGDVRVSHATVVTDAAILVFREGLEAVLILATITASFVGARRHLRRPVLIGGLAGIGATAITWLLVQLLISELGVGGLRLEAVTGILAIAVLLVVTNWFFHRVYWSEWIARFNRRRKSLEQFDRLGFLSGQTIALVLLGLTSVYREGFETVLFLQNLQVSAGTGATLVGTGIGLAGTLAVGGVTFFMQRKLPYKKMLIATGVLIAVVLAVMTGTTVHVMQGLGWMPSTPTGFSVDLWANRWLGIFATWEGLVAQAGALVIVLGSYVLAREVQVKGPQRRARRTSGNATQGA